MGPGTEGATGTGAQVDPFLSLSQSSGRGRLWDWQGKAVGTGSCLRVGMDLSVPFPEILDLPHPDSPTDLPK